MVNLNGMSQRELAKKIGVSAQYLSAIFNGEKTLSEERVKQITELVPELKDKFVVKQKSKITYLYQEVGE